MRFEFSWGSQTGEASGTFRTSCPIIGEVMMRSRADFPKRPESMHAEFDQLYGNERGKFEQVLRDKEKKNQFGYIETGIRGLMVHAVNDGGMDLC